MIYIPEACHEDFSKMNTTERGAFCDKCKIDTFDFRHLSNYEINSIIKNNKDQHLCGRFNSNQIEELNAGFVEWKSENKKVFQSKFILALLVVFGLSLFSCQENKVETVIEHIGQLEIPNDNAQLEHINSSLAITEIDLLNFIKEHPPITKETDIQGELINCNKIYETAGGIAYIPKENPMDYFNNMVAGDLMYDPDYEEYVNETIITDSVESNSSEQILNVDIFSAKVFPNPTQNFSTISLDIKVSGQFGIDMYNTNGQLIENIYSGDLSKGSQNFKIDMNHLNAGFYIIKILSQDQNETLKISKIN